MRPGPAIASPPETDQLTGAADPLASAAENRCTGNPRPLVALQPAQLVSTLAMPGEIVKAAFAELAASPAVPHPARPMRKGAARMDPASSTHRRRPTPMGEVRAGVRVLGFKVQASFVRRTAG